MARFMPSISEEFLELKPPKFIPYVFIQTTEYMPTSIAMAAAAGGGMKYINLPETFAPADLPKVQQIVQEHHKENEGNCILFGRVVAYLFVFTPTEGILLDVNGNEIGRQTGKYHPQSIAIQKEL
jgi:hypothetical protein